jgi:mono/diheme cytochrome c family protein
LVKICTHSKRSRAKVGLWTLAGLSALAVVIQWVPYGRDHTARPATKPFKWSTPAAEAIAKASCYDCHSSETRWWWAVKIAPFSWLAQADIDEAKRRVDFSEWNGKLTAEGLQRAINRNMPPLQFTLFHSEAKLTDAMKQTLMEGFQASWAANQASASVALEATAIINERCSVCHSPSAPLQFRAPSAQVARALIDTMVQRGAKVSPAEEQALIGYFTR